MEMDNSYSMSMVERARKTVAEANEKLDHYKHRPRATKWSADRFYNFKRKKGKMK